jgi:hypothetical protein
MTWSVADFIVQTVAGILGALMVRAVETRHGFGVAGDALIGLFGGALSGYFLQGFVGRVVTGAGSVNPSTPVEGAVVQGLAGAVSGGCLLLLLSLVRRGIREHGSHDKKARP